MKLKFTVVTVAFNGADVIEKTMRSVLTQTTAPCEYLIFDGGSTDGTWETVNALASEFAAAGIPLRARREPDTGIYNAMNKGIRAASGDFISFLNAGDWYEPDALSNVAAFYAAEPFDLTYGGLHYIQTDGSVRDKMSRLDRFPISSRNWNHPSMFLRREIYRKYYFDEAFRTYADFDLYLKLRKDGTRIRVIDKILTNFVADGVSTATGLKKVLVRAGEKYRAYRHNGYGPAYWVEAYGWELLKTCYMKLHSGKKNSTALRYKEIARRIVRKETPMNSNWFKPVLKLTGTQYGKGLRLRGVPVIFNQRGATLKIGQNCTINSGFLSNLVGLYSRTILVTRLSGAQIIIGDNVGISGATIYARHAITIGDNTMIGGNVKILDNDFHPIEAAARLRNDGAHIRAKAVTIGKNCFIGCNSILLKGTTLGDGCVVGAGAVVSGTFEANCVIAGNPATVIRRLDE